ncbi:UDP-galactopyranose mutase [Riemerella anatipestifer]|uniref:UDP-galactopyranose mutase n=1 Tax=Riemerella anatipestifer TaxID=34085 RepID=UPI00129E070F|nr:UDP-galactopyranose mutase [Riemerella anatipestifer]MBT0552489.1 UDP-galactopyranose mutase [Riemerella anatipestifer]MBT0554777.1 UDP-galactopyranose mutase [Riemerella anatipestifer]MCE3025360.1 UDP-galactopyranose mutase [Riemerella anatipestifer]MCU7543233.1 UDP-galactopyranose mutase [Riemerella anatipestifer]MCU7560879.1 UDP-galactopyranose mutase [Riemerella anatipestifer]
MSKQYDYLIVGSGLFGAVFACEMTKKGKKCLVIERREHIAGNIYTENIEGINVHKYGAHIFHTSNKEVWDYVNSFVEFNRYTNSPIANYKGNLYNLPFNMNTFYQLWGVKTPAEARAKIEGQRAEYKHIVEPKNLEEQALVLGGKDIYEKLIKGYTEKQWGRPATEIPAFIIRRLPFRFTFDNNYFNDTYQGVPNGGYTLLVEKMLEGIEVRLNTDYFNNREHWDSIAETVVYTGKIDEFFDFQYGALDYRSLRFETEILDEANYQGNAVVNYTEREIPFTRIIEHKHFEFGAQPKTIITREYPQDMAEGEEAYYPINDEKNQAVYQKYKTLADGCKNVIFGGRLAEYKYYDMHQVVAKALEMVASV